MYVPSHELTLTDEEIFDCVAMLSYELKLSFQSRSNRDAVYKLAKDAGLRVRKSSIAHQVVDPRYTTEGKLAGLPDKGLANDSIMTNLYEVVLI